MYMGQRDYSGRQRLYVSGKGPKNPADELIIGNMEVPKGAAMIYFVVKKNVHIPDKYNAGGLSMDYEILSPIFKIKKHAKDWWTGQWKEQQKAGKPFADHIVDSFYCDL